MLTTYTAPFAVTAEGTTTVEYLSIDGAGNTEATKTATVRIDRTAPSVTDDAPGTWVNGPVDVSLSATDTGAGVESVALLHSTAQTPQTPTPARSRSAPRAPPRSSTAPPTRWATPVRIRTAVVRIDDTAPVSSDDAPAGWARGAVAVKLSATDTHSGITRTAWSLDGSGVATYTAPIQVAGDGTHTIEYASTDIKGNTESTRTATVRIDDTAPVTTCDAVASYTATAVVSFTASDTLSGVARTEYRIDGGGWTAGQNVVTSAPGRHVLDYRSTDMAGNIEDFKSSAFDVVGRVEQTSNLLDFAGTWVTASNPSHSAGNYLYTVTPGSAMNMSFTGTSISWITLRGPSNGIARVTLDGGTPVDVNLYADTSQFKQTVWQVNGLSNGRHTLRIECTGSKDTSSTGKFVGVDALEIVGSPTERRYEQSEALMNFAGSWTDKTDVGMSGGGYKFTGTAGASLNVAFTGSKIEWVTVKGPNNGVARVTLDGGAPIRC